MRIRNWFAILILALLPVGLSGQNRQGAAVISVDAANPGAAISSAMYGIFFEDINFGADGGLYPELVKNRVLRIQRAADRLARDHGGQRERDSMFRRASSRIRTDDPLNATNPHYLRVSVYDPGYGFYNAGFRGMGVERRRRISLLRLCAQQRTEGDPRHDHRRRPGTKSAAESWKDSAANGSNMKRSFAPTPPSSKRALNLFVDGTGTVDLDMVSLFPVDTWKHRPNGLRKDLVQLLSDMHPGVHSLPRRLHRRRPPADDALSLEDHGRRHRRAQDHRQPLERRVRSPARARLFPVVRPRLLRVLPTGRRHRREAAADSELRHGLPVQFERDGEAR